MCTRSGVTLRHMLTGVAPRDGQADSLPSGDEEGLGELRDAIAACTHPDPGARPSMKDVVRILSGEPWADIREQRRQRQQLLVGALGVGAAVWLISALGKSASGAARGGHPA